MIPPETTGQGDDVNIKSSGQRPVGFLTKPMNIFGQQKAQNGLDKNPSPPTDLRTTWTADIINLPEL